MASSSSYGDYEDKDSLDPSLQRSDNMYTHPYVDIYIPRYINILKYAYYLCIGINTPNVDTYP